MKKSSPEIVKIFTHLYFFWREALYAATTTLRVSASLSAELSKSGWLRSAELNNLGFFFIKENISWKTIKLLRNIDCFCQVTVPHQSLQYELFHAEKRMRKQQQDSHLLTLRSKTKHFEIHWEIMSTCNNVNTSPALGSLVGSADAGVFGSNLGVLNGAI